MVLERVQGTRWYSETYFFRDGVTVYSSPRSKKLARFMVEMRGDFFESFGDHAVDCALYFIAWCRVTRIDWCWDFVSRLGDLEPSFSVEDLIPKRRQKVEPKGYYEGGQYVDTGFVSGISDFRLRYYDKKIESDCQDWEILEWWRFEVVIRGNLSKYQNWADEAGNVTRESVSKVVAGAFLRRFKLDKINLEGKCLPSLRARDTSYEERLTKARNRAVSARLRYRKLSEQRGMTNGVFGGGDSARESQRRESFLRFGCNGRALLGLGS